MTERGEGHDGADFTVLSGDPTPTELAAVAAVLSAAIQEATTSGGSTRQTGRSAWQLAQRPIRRPIERGVVTWRSFSG